MPGINVATAMTTSRLCDDDDNHIEDGDDGTSPNQPLSSRPDPYAVLLLLPVPLCCS